MSNITKGIVPGSAFARMAPEPLDLKTTAATLQERNSYVDAKVLYKGALVYVEENDTFYVYTGAEPSESDYTPCFKELLGGIATDSTVVKVTGDQDVGGVKNFTSVPTISGTPIASTQDVETAVTEGIESAVTSQVGVTIQAHSDQLDKVAALADVGLVYRKADGTIQGMTVEAADASVTVNTDESAKKVTVALPATGTAGTYTKVTTDAQGRVTSGENPTTLEGYGITDAVSKAGGVVTGPLKYDASITEEDFDDNTLVPKYYADSVALGYASHKACETGSASNVEGSYVDGSSVPDSPGVGATFTFTADTGNTTEVNGVVLTAGMRVLLVGQTDAKQNGAYVVTNVPEGATGNVVMERADDFDGEPRINYDGASFLIAQGNLKGTVWKLVNQGEITFGTDNIEFVQVFTPNSYSEGDGITIDANTISVKQGATVKVIGGNLEVASGSGNQGKVLVAQGDGAAATWQTINTDFQEIAPSGQKGDLMYHDGSKWTVLPKGAANTLLGVGADGELVYLTKLEQGTF